MLRLTGEHATIHRYGLCASIGCWRRSSDHARYCSETCQERESKRRYRYRLLLRRERIGCLACGAVHHDDGSVAL
jgi:hypothetical protein